MAPRDRQHIIVPFEAKAEPFAPPRRAISPKTPPIPPNRSFHGNRLTTELNIANQQAWANREQVPAIFPQRSEGIYVTFESFPGLELVLESLDPRQGKSHPELLSVQIQEIEGKRTERATVYIPDGKLGYFFTRLQQYVDSADQQKTKNAKLLDTIQSIGLASLRELWTDVPNTFPASDKVVWWELWLRRRDGQELMRLENFAQALDLRLGHRTLGFANRLVVLIEARPSQLTLALDVLDDFAELRRPKEPATILANEPAADQSAWVTDLLSRTIPASMIAPAVCVIDTGVHQPHPLLSHSLAPDDCHACDPRWKTDDHHGHGTEMAGLVLYGDLGAAFLAPNPIHLRHRLESVKILPPPPRQNLPENYGALTATCISLTEITTPNRRRLFSMAVTAESETFQSSRNDRILFGQPSSWSAAVDALSAGLSIDTERGHITFLDANEDNRRLFIVSAGNVVRFDNDHLSRSDLSPIENPAQAWNALTVGAYTELDIVREPDLDGWTTLAQKGDLSPYSRTSVAWSKIWPDKPEVVMEGGNIACSPKGSEFDSPDSLQLLTTKAPLLAGTDTRLLTATSATSAATAQAAHLGAAILAEYPNLWPETVRALIVHSAEWTSTMQRQFNAAQGKRQRVVLKRRYGMGVPDLGRATRSAIDALTLVIQDEITPFDSNGKMREMHLHDLPWPVEELTDLGAATVKLRITLSYFIEPNPGARGWVRRYSYASHGLRFDVRRRAESKDEFRKRINAKALAEEERRPSTESDSDEWYFGSDNRVLGSLHTDIWQGSAIDLASRGAVAVFPVSGWWKFREIKQNDQRRSRYALILSIETPGQDVDIWTPVAQQIGIPIEIVV